jgi:hypothetical protein
MPVRVGVPVGAHVGVGAGVGVGGTVGTGVGGAVGVGAAVAMRVGRGVGAGVNGLGLATADKVAADVGDVVGVVSGVTLATVVADGVVTAVFAGGADGVGAAAMVIEGDGSTAMLSAAGAPVGAGAQASTVSASTQRPRTAFPNSCGRLLRYDTCV